ncbi:DNA sulfur modification protein DndB [Oculatella sp. LEGE 06141]|uniref:DNA sulfur modification protein DndB n=1 Tax=Oculatella sp. LEGE 06141 TaxID=1828648 RepID=UPI00188137AB|nr:DNA sulfur modification protein DndB [Oculatella sp. LEGE 06141]
MPQRTAVAYQFPATQGFQCREFFWLTALSFEQAKAAFQPFLDQATDPGINKPLTLSQRTLDPKRGKKIRRYVIKGLSAPKEFYILPTITVTMEIPADSYFEFCGVEPEPDIPGFGSNQIAESGFLIAPSGTVFSIPDGQHRALGAILSCLEAPKLVQRETIGVMLIPDPGGTRKRQTFLDINQYAVKPSKSIVSLFDNRDEYSEIARTVLAKVSVFDGHTHLEATNVPKNGIELFTMNALRESCKFLLTGIEEDGTQFAVNFWEKVAQYHPVWKMVDSCDSLSELRLSTVSFNALTLNALAIAGNQRPSLEWVEYLNQINWSVDNPEWEGLIQFGGRIVKNNQTIRGLAEYIRNQTS